MIEQNTFTPDWISSPGETIEDILEERGWTKKDFADRAGFSTKHVNELVKGRVSITAEMAERLSRVLGSTPAFWLTSDASYQAALERRRVIEEACEDADWLKELPLSSMKKYGWIREFKNKGEQVLECLRYFGVHSVDIWRQQYPNQYAAFRASDKFEKKAGAVAAWLRKAEQDATQMRCAPYSKKGFREALGELRALTCEPDPEVFVPRMQELCAEQGVAVVFVRAPKDCPASGATKWLSPDKAMLVLSLRHKSNDHLWFTFFHEAGHILLHSKKMLFIEDIGGLEDDCEKEADRFAADWLIAPSAAKKLCELAKKPYLSKNDVADFAHEMGVAPGVVVGRMQKEGWLPLKFMNDLKERYDWSQDGGLLWKQDN